MKRTRFRQAATATAICATVAAMVGIATGAAAPSHKNGSGTRRAAPPMPFAGPIGPPPGGHFRVGFRGPDAFGGPPVHSEMVVPNKAGDDFITVTQDNGKVNSVSGTQLTITEGTEDATYKTVSLDVPGDAKVVRDGKKAELGDLQEGDQVHVSQSSEGSFVFATDKQFQKKMLKQFRAHMKDLPKPPKGLRGGPPPGMPGPMAGQQRRY